MWMKLLFRLYQSSLYGKIHLSACQDVHMCVLQNSLFGPGEDLQEVFHSESHQNIPMPMKLQEQVSR